MGKKITIANGQSVSSMVDLKFLRAANLTPPAALTANTARIGFLGSHDGGTTNSYVVNDVGARHLLTVDTTPDGVHWLPADIFKGFRWLAIETLQADGTTVQAQGAAREFDLELEKYTD